MNTDTRFGGIGLDDIQWSLRGPDGHVREILRGVSLEIEPGTITSLVGPSGCGKTTLLRILAGLQTPTSGDVRRRGRVGFVFQRPALLPWLTAGQNVRLPLDLTGEANKPSTVQGLLEQVDLADAADLYPAQLSGGMQMRVSLARALATRPDVLLLDEPLSALDEMLREQLGELLLRLWQTQRFTAVMVTHNIAEAIWLAHRVLVMSSGQIVDDIAVNLPWPRQPSIQTEPRFTNHFETVANRLRQTTSGKS